MTALLRQSIRLTFFTAGGLALLIALVSLMSDHEPGEVGARLLTWGPVFVAGLFVAAIIGAAYYGFTAFQGMRASVIRHLPDLEKFAGGGWLIEFTGVSPDKADMRLAHHVYLQQFGAVQAATYVADPPARGLIVTSMAQTPGKLTFAVGLASYLASRGRRTVVIDANLRHPTFEWLFERDRLTGLSDDVAAEQGPLLIRTTNDPYLGFVTAGNLPPAPADTLRAPRMRHFLDDLAAAGRAAILVAPSIGDLSDVPILASQAPDVVLVIPAGRVTEGELARALMRIERVRARVRGLVLIR